MKQKKKTTLTLGAILSALVLALAGRFILPEGAGTTGGVSVTPTVSEAAGGAAGSGVNTSTGTGGIEENSTGAGGGTNSGGSIGGGAADSSETEAGGTNNGAETGQQAVSYTLDTLPPFDGSTAYVMLYDNTPSFAAEEQTATAFEDYAALDALGRCGVACACIGQELMPTEPRGSISQVKPSGWQSVRYAFVDGESLYNRCHLIGFQLAGENANERNLITGTRFLNTEGMLPFENMVADYVKETNYHVLYRVTPIFVGDELVARGVQMEAYSVEDQGEGICFNVYAYNNQPQIEIDYATGNNWLADGTQAEATSEETKQSYVLNTSSKRFHLPSCASVATIKEANKKTVSEVRSELLAQGYAPCGSCAP